MGGPNWVTYPKVPLASNLQKFCAATAHFLEEMPRGTHHGPLQKKPPMLDSLLGSSAGHFAVV